MEEVYFTTHKASKYCNVYPSTVINWINEGLLEAFTTPGGHRRIKKSDLLKLMKKNNMPIPDELVEGEKNKVLVVDDDPKILKMIETILLSEDNIEVFTAKDGFEAGSMVYSKNPDLILLDFRMPNMDGFEVCRRLKSDDKTKDIPIIAVTVLSEEKEIKNMFDAGVIDHLPKPFKTEELIEKIKNYLTISSS